MTPSCGPFKLSPVFLVAFAVVFQLTSLCLLLLTPATSADPRRYHDYCIVGAGPAGLQLGHYMQKANRDYVIFERSNVSGNFFVTYPRHRKLISINKRYTGKTNKEFNMRHDWNSLLSDDESLLFKEYSKEMFPHADRLLDYLRDYRQKLGIKVQFNTDVRNIHSVGNSSAPDGVLHVFNDQHGNTYGCRAVNNGLLDTYQLKSLDGVLEASVTEARVQKIGDKLKIIPHDSVISVDDNFAVREPYDKVIRCLGFTFDSSVFTNETEVLRGNGRAKKYPAINHNYESKTMPGVFYAGTAAHSLDFRKSAGGFIHGFRYTARTLARLLEWRYEGVPWPSHHVPVTQLMNVLLKRLNEASGSYQMFQVLGDVAVFSEDGKSVDYFEEFPINLLHEFPEHTGRQATRLLAVVMEYGIDFSGPGKDIFRSDRATQDPSDAHNSNFLHPVLYYYERLPTSEEMRQRAPKQTLPRPVAMHHMVEDFLTLWDGPHTHLAPLRHFLDHVTAADLRSRFAQPCFMESMTNREPSAMCNDQFMQGQGMTAMPDMIAAIEGPRISTV